MSMEKWLNELKKVPKAAILQNKNKKVHFTFENRELIEEFNVETNVLVRRTWIMKNPFGKVISTEVEIGDPEPQRFQDDSIGINAEQPVVLRRMTKLNLEWRIRNLPYEIDNYSISVDNEKKAIIVRTHNKKYFKILKVPDFERIGLELNTDLLTYSHKFKTLIITYKKPIEYLNYEKLHWEIINEVPVKFNEENSYCNPS